MDKKQRPNVLITTYSSSFAPDTKQQVSGETAYDQGEDSFGFDMQFFTKKSIFHRLNQIKGPTGSVRGHKDVVRTSLEKIKVATTNSRRNFSSSILPTFLSINGNQGVQQLDKQAREKYLDHLVYDERDLCVAYTTTLGVIRRTFNDSKTMRSILSLNLIRYEERDIYLNREYKHQLRMRSESLLVPALFVNGKFFGGIKELEVLNESGKLSLLLAKFKMTNTPKGICLCCGNAKFIACQSCHGSRKSSIHHFKFNSVALRCIKCDMNEGLIACPACSASKSLSVDLNNNS